MRSVRTKLKPVAHMNNFRVSIDPSTVSLRHIMDSDVRQQGLTTCTHALSPIFACIRPNLQWFFVLTVYAVPMPAGKVCDGLAFTFSILGEFPE